MKTFFSPNELGARPLAVKTEQISSLANTYIAASKTSIAVVTPVIEATPVVENATSQLPANNVVSDAPSMFEEVKTETPQSTVATPVSSNNNVEENMFASTPQPVINQFDIPVAPVNVVTTVPVVNQFDTPSVPISEPVVSTDVPVSLTPVVEEPVVIQQESIKIDGAATLQTSAVTNEVSMLDKLKQAYIVEKGDTIEKICKTFGYNVPNFLAYNKLAITTTIMPGMILFFPFNESEFTKVDELSYDRISKKLVKLAKINKLDSGNALSGLNNAGELSLSSETNIFN